MSSTISTGIFSSNEYIKNEIFRCPNCFHAQLIELFKRKDNIMAKLKCLNGHFYEKTLENALKEIKRNQINDAICTNCNKDYSKFSVFYCKQHNNFLCKSCSYKHPDCQLILLSNFDVNCFIHNKYNIYFCKICQKEICIDCLKNGEHKNHNYFTIESLDKNFIEEYQNNIEKIEKYLNKFNEEFEKLMKQINKDINIINNLGKSLINNIQLEIFISKNLINAYKDFKKNNQLSYTIIENVRNFSFKFQSFDISKKTNLKKSIEQIISLFSESHELLINSNTDFSNLYSSSNSKSRTDSINYSKKSNSLYSSLSSLNSINSKNSNNLSEKKEYQNYIVNPNDNIINPIDKKINKQNMRNKSFKFRKNIMTSSTNGILITALIFTNENQLVTGNENGKIDIYSIDKNFILEKSFIPHNKSINYLVKLKDGKIISCSNDSQNNISLLEINNNSKKLKSYIKGHNDKVNQVIEISNYNIISCSSDKTIKIFEKNNEKYKEISSKKFDSSINGIIELNDKGYACTDFYNEKILFLDNYLNIIYEMKDIKCGSLPKSIISINSEIFAVGGEGLYIISISKREIINYISSNFAYMKCLFFDNDCNELIIGDENGCFSIYNIENKNFEMLDSKILRHNEVIYSIIKNEDGFIVSSSKNLKLWGNNI